MARLADYRLFLDDERNPPSDGKEWIVVRSSAEAKHILHERGFPKYASFDHDLGDDDTTMVFLKGMVDYLIDNEIEDLADFEFYVHSQNPVGKKNIEEYLGSLIRFLVSQ